MFCQKCGAKAADDAGFCHKCGALIQEDTQSASNIERGTQSNTSANPYTDLSNKWVWLIAIIPTFILLIVPLLGLYPNAYGEGHEFTSFIFLAIAFVVTCLFLFMDYKELTRNGINNVKPWVGVLLIPAYLFIRAARSTRKFNYAIVWSVFYAFYLILYFYFVVLQN